MNEYFAHIRKEDKRGQLLLDHLSGVAELSSRFAAKVGLAYIGYVLGWLHDLGKATELFQHYLLSAAGIIPKGDRRWLDSKRLKGKIDHATAGAQVIFALLWNNGGNDKLLAQILALCIASHHSGLIDCLTPYGRDKFTERMAKADKDVRKLESLRNFPEIQQALGDERLKEMVDELATKMASLARSVRTKELGFFNLGLLIRFLLSCLIDADRLDSADDESPEKKEKRNYGVYTAWPVLVDRLEAELAIFDHKKDRNEVDEIRHQVSDACLEFAQRPKGIYQLTVPTGGGKTLASLRFALNHAKARDDVEHIFYIVPYTSIIDQNARQIREILEERGVDGRYLDKVVLEHHSNLTPESERVDGGSREGAMEEENSRQSLLSENWDAPVVLTTQVQFLEALFGGGTRSVRRMHQLANSIIILDEVQTFPVKTIHMLNAALQFLVNDCGATVVLCTATQPPLDKIPAAHRAITLGADSHIISDEQELYERLKRVEVHYAHKNLGWSVEDVAGLAEEQMEALGSTLIVVNTRSQARALYDLLATRKPDDVKLYHLSTRMCAAHRLKVIEEMKEHLGPCKPERVICVSTQLIEAGVDIDFGCVIRYLAGLDSIAQAAGRCNRSGKRKYLGQVFVVNAQGETLGSRLAEIEMGARQTEALVKLLEENGTLQQTDLVGLEAMAAYYSEVFKMRAGEMSYPIHADGYSVKENIFNLLSMNKLACEQFENILDNGGKRPSLAFLHAFQSGADQFKVIETDTVGVIVQYGDGKRIVADLQDTEDLLEQRTILKRAQRYSVNLFRPTFNKLERAKIVNETIAGSGIYYLEEEYYGPEFGWSETRVSESSLLIVGS